MPGVWASIPFNREIDMSRETLYGKLEDLENKAKEYTELKAQMDAIETVIESSRPDFQKIEIIKNVLVSVLIDGDLCFARRTVDLSPPKPHDGRGPG